MAKAILEIVSAEMRIFSDDDAEYGEPFEFFVGVRFISRTNAQVDGLENDRRFTLQHAAAVRPELKRYGVTDYSFTRIKNGVEKPVKGKIR